MTTQSLPMVTQTDHRNQGIEKKQGDCVFSMKCLKDKYKTILIYILLAISIILSISLANIGILHHINKNASYIYLHRSAQDSCPDDWIGFQNKCYYFSKEEGDWNSSRHNCVTQHADLTMIDTEKEMRFLKRHKCTSDHWIGLEMTENQTGRWVNGTIFNKWFAVRGNEKCAYLDDEGAAAARCYTERKWICRRKMR